MLSEDGVDLIFGVYMETRAGILYPHIVLLHGLGGGNLISNDEKGGIPIYYWNSWTIKYQAPLSMWLEEAWLVGGKDNIDVNNFDSVG